MNNNKEHDSKTVVKKKDTLSNEMAENRLENMCLKEFRKTLDEADIHHYDPNLDIVMEYAAELKDSIALLKEFFNGNRVESDENSCPKNLFEYHDQRAKHHFKILKEHRWFNELIEIDPRFNYPEQQTK